MKEVIQTRWRGVLLCLCIAVPSWVVVLLFSRLEVIGAPVIAILAGMAVAALAGKRLGPSLRPGIQYTSKKILQYAVVLLGFGLNLTTLGKVGASSLPIILSTILISLIVSFVLSRVLHIEGKIATLVGVGSSICGGSAVAATAPVIDADDEQIAQAISVIFLFNVIAALIFPTLGGLLGLSNEGFGLFAGTAVNDTSSVTAAASTWDTLHGTNGMVLEYATIVKLTRTLAIIPITLILALWRAKTANARQKVTIRQVFPMFILYFVLASVITTVLTAALSGGALDAANAAFHFLKQLSKFFIVLAMAAIGLGTDIVKLVKTGGKPIFLGFCCWVAITAVSLLMQHLLGLF